MSLPERCGDAGLAERIIQPGFEAFCRSGFSRDRVIVRLRQLHDRG